MKISIRNALLSSVCCLWVLVLVAVFPQGVCGGSGDSEKLTIFTVNYPLKYFAQRIAGSHAKVIFPCPAQEDPAYWVPAVSIVSAYQKADLILLNGAGYAKWVRKVSLPRSRIVDTSINFKGRYVKLAGAVEHTHGPEGKHAHEGIAFTTWLDLDLASKQASAILASLVRKRPGLRRTFRENYVVLDEELEALDREIQAIVSTDPSRSLVASHPVYQYLAKRYGLNIKSMHWEPGEFPGEEQWHKLNKVLQGHPARSMIWEGAPLRETANRLTSLGITSFVFDPCGNTPDRGDFMTVMRQNIKNLKGAFQ